MRMRREHAGREYDLDRNMASAHPITFAQRTGNLSPSLPAAVPWIFRLSIETRR